MMSHRTSRRVAATLLSIAALAAAASSPLGAQGADRPVSRPIERGTPGTPAEARAFMERVERELNELSIRANQAQWVADNFITDDTEALSAEAT